LSWIFGPVKENIVHIHQRDAAAGFLSLANARVRWFLSTNVSYLPDDAIKKEMRTFRSITVDGQDIEFSGGFMDLHTRSYQEILSGRGFGLAEARASIETVHYIRNAVPKGNVGDFHPLCRRIQSI
ncbi:MAG: oxidoreductase, partial [Deltaproteobacteria bacterium]|nr:oxidoreductase [Deltaproteobacteria bacterium]